MLGGTNGADGRGRRRDRGAEFPVVAVLGHCLHFDKAEAGGIGNRGPRHAGEDHAGDDVHVAEAAANVADQSAGEIEHALCVIPP